MWTSWPCHEALLIGKWPRGVSEGAEASQEQLGPHNVVSAVVAAAVCPNAATIWGMLGEHKVEIMLDSGLSISLIQESTATPFSREYKILPSGLRLTSASGDNIPILDCVTLPLCIGELQVMHPLVVVKTLIAPVILGLDFFQKHGIILDVTSSPVKFNVQHHDPSFDDYSENVKPVLDIARQITNKVCAFYVLTDTTEDTIDNCAEPLFVKENLQYDIPVCKVPAFICVLDQYKHLFRTYPGHTTIAEHFIPTTGTPIKVPPQQIPANYCSEVENQIQTMLHERVIKECSSPWMATAVFVRKKTGDIRICVDYRELNKKTVKDAYPLHHPDVIQDRLSGSVIFSTLDLVCNVGSMKQVPESYEGYWNLVVQASHIQQMSLKGQVPCL